MQIYKINLTMVLDKKSNFLFLYNLSEKLICCDKTELQMNRQIIELNVSQCLFLLLLILAIKGSFALHHTGTSEERFTREQ